MGIGLGTGIVAGALGGVGEGMATIGERQNKIDMAKLENDLITSRQTALARVQTDEGIRKYAADAQTDISNAPAKTAAETEKERQKRALAPDALQAQQIAESKSREEYNRGARAALAQANAAKAAGAGDKAAEAAVNKQAQVAASELTTTMRAEKNDDGTPKYGSDDILKYGGIASRLVKYGGYSGPEAASIARSAPLKSGKEIDAQLAGEESKLEKVGVIGSVTGSGSRGDVKIGDQTMPIDTWRTQRRAQLRAQNDTELAAWAEQNGLPAQGPAGGRAQPSNGAPYPEGTILEKEGKKYEVKGGKPVPLEPATGDTALPGYKDKPVAAGTGIAGKATAAPDAGAFDQGGTAGTGIVGKAAVKPLAKMEYKEVPPPPARTADRKEWEAWDAQYGEQYAFNQAQIAAGARSSITASQQENDERYRKGSLKAKQKRE